MSIFIQMRNLSVALNAPRSSKTAVTYGGINEFILVISPSPAQLVTRHSWKELS